MEAALSALIEEHIPLVQHIVYQVAVHFPRHVDRQELARAGTLGLVEAAHRWDPSRGVPFGRFVARRIKGAILDAVRAADWAPRSVRQQSRELEEARHQISARLGTTPTTEELAREMGVSVEELATLEARISRSVVLTLDQMVESDEDQDLTFGDALADSETVDPSEALEQKELQAYVVEGVKLLPERMRDIVVGHFFEGKSDDELAETLGVTKSRISQLRTEALVRIRDGVRAQYEDPDQAAEALAGEMGRVACRKAAYATAIASRNTWRTRLEQVDAALPAMCRVSA